MPFVDNQDGHKTRPLRQNASVCGRQTATGGVNNHVVSRMLQAFQNGEGPICDAAVVFGAFRGFVSVCFSLKACLLGEVK